jgi:hypothetical protein
MRYTKRVILLFSIELECDTPILEALFVNWPAASPNALLRWLFLALRDYNWTIGPLNLKFYKALLKTVHVTPCQRITFDWRFERGDGAFLISAGSHFNQRWTLTLMDLKGPHHVIVVWKLQQKEWIFSYNQHTDYGFKVLAENWLK